MAKRKANKKPGEEKLANAKWELFAHLYSGHHNSQLFGNGTQCYSLAYGYTDKIAAAQEMIEELTSKGEAGYTVKVKAQEASIRRMRNLCSVEAARLLVNPRIRNRCDWLLENMISSDFADRELQFVIAQRQDLQAKVQAIKEHNRVKQRVSDKVEGELVVRWEDPEPAAKR